MFPIVAIAVKELSSFSKSLFAPILLTIYCLYTGQIFFNLLSPFHAPSTGVVSQFPQHLTRTLNLNMHVIQPFFGLIFSFGLFIIPLLTMKSIAAEKKKGTIRLLQSVPITSWEIVWGKFIGFLLTISLFLLVSSFYIAILPLAGDPDVLPIFSGYLGIFLLFASFGAIGIFCSSLTESQVIAATLTSVIIMIFWFLNRLFSSNQDIFKVFINNLTYGKHIINLIQGVIYLSDIFYFVGMTTIFLYFTFLNIEYQKWR